MVKKLILPLLLLVGLLGAAQGADVVVRYPNAQMGYAHVTSSSQDAADLGVIPITSCFSINNFQTVKLTGYFSIAGATCKFHLVRGWTDGTTFHPINTASGTATADGHFTLNSLYVSDALAFDTGLPFAAVLIDAPSSGTVEIVWEGH